MAEDWKEANLKRVKDYDAVQKAKKTVAEYDPKEPNKPQWKKDNEARIKAYDEPKKQSFGDAFKEARKAGKDTFTFNGKPYTTETAEEKAKSKPAPTGNIGSRTMLDEGETMPTFKKGGKVSSASKRADGCAIRGKTRA